MSKSKSKEIKTPKVISVFASIHSTHFSDKDHEEIAKALRDRNDEICPDTVESPKSTED